jgi:5S rRNA maturation endonuclease (ribonuclease M5)
LTTGGKWVDAPFKSYGEQRLYRIDLTRNGVNKTVYATKEHRWFLKEHKGRVAERTTETLNVGNILASVIPDRPKPTHLDVNGIQHGFVLGDGTIDKRKRYAKAYLYHDKIAFMSPYFADCTPKTGHRTYHYDWSEKNHAYQGKQTVITGFPLDYKDVPSIESEPEYILGFLAGLLAADGHVDKSGTTSLHSSRKQVLLKIRDLATKVGISTLSLTRQSRKGYGAADSDIYRIHFLRSTLPSWLLLNPEHRERFEGNPPQLNYLCWRVTGIRETKRIETVYCCEVPETHAFALEDNILTGNCFGCRARASTHGGWNGLAKELGLSTIEGDSAQITNYVRREPRVEELYDPEEGWDLEKLLEQWNCGFHMEWPEHQKFRGLPGWLMRKVGALLTIDEKYENQVAILPQYNGHILTGAVKARCKVFKKTRLKYLSAPGEWVKTHALFPYHLVERMLEIREDRTIILVEGSRDALRLIGCGIPALALLGTNNWSEEKRDLLMTLGPDRVIFGFDNDSAGQKAIKLVAPTLKGYVHRSTIKFLNDKEDPGSVPVEQIRAWKKKWKIETTRVRDMEDHYRLLSA